MASEQGGAVVEVGYWTIRGLGAALRMMCEYGCIPYRARCFDVREKAEGGWDLSTWLVAKAALKTVNPLINLPYVKDTDGTVVAQTNACLVYLGEKMGLMGSSARDRCKVHQLLCEAMDLRNAMCGVFYGGPEAGLAGLLGHPSLDKLEASVVGPYFLGDRPCAADFMVAEHFAQLVVLAVHINATMPHHPKLHQLLVTMETEPKLQRYYASKLAKLPINNKMAIFASAPDGQRYVSGTPYDWAYVTNDVPTNAAFIFIKPHAVTDAFVGLVTGYLAGKGLQVVSSGTIAAEEIDAKMLIDHHYGSIASKATLLEPAELNVPADAFKRHFGLDWTEALESKRCFNALGACRHLGCDAATLDAMWADCKREGRLAKFGGGFYCGELTTTAPESGGGGGAAPGGSIFVFNGFFMAMRAKFTEPGTGIKFFAVEWPLHALSWADFRGLCIGHTDPADAPRDSLRGLLDEAWASLGLAAAPTVGDNGVHASASPFEALAERANWLQAPIKADPFGQLCLAAGLGEETLKAWALDPQVRTLDGARASLFDLVEDTDVDDCLAKLIELNGSQ